MVIVNVQDIPDDLPPGKYCCHLDESTTWREFRVRFVVPPRVHEPLDCLIHLIKEGDSDE